MCLPRWNYTGFYLWSRRVEESGDEWKWEGFCGVLDWRTVRGTKRKVFGESQWFRSLDLLEELYKTR